MRSICSELILFCGTDWHICGRKCCKQRRVRRGQRRRSLQSSGIALEEPMMPVRNVWLRGRLNAIFWGRLARGWHRRRIHTRGSSFVFAPHLVSVICTSSGLQMQSQRFVGDRLRIGVIPSTCFRRSISRGFYCCFDVRNCWCAWL